MSNRRAGVAAGLIAVGWAVALAGEVVSTRSDRATAWLRDREIMADRPHVGTFGRLTASSWPSYLASAVLAGYTSLMVLSTGRTGRWWRVTTVLCLAGAFLAGGRLSGDAYWSLWEVAVGDGMSVVGYLFGILVTTAPKSGGGDRASG